ncbi:MAG: hypothetical protein U5M53_13310 [Rhodoferax sp.]|nr:hypothetical protein [Rhodoferax sp.]
MRLVVIVSGYTLDEAIGLSVAARSAVAIASMFSFGRIAVCAVRFALVEITRASSFATSGTRASSAGAARWRYWLPARTHLPGQ